MTAEQKRLVAALADGAARPTLTLRELAGESGDIGDPVGQGEDTYRPAATRSRAVWRKASTGCWRRIPVSCDAAVSRGGISLFSWRWSPARW
jgi:hypothetical protein